MAPPHRLGWAKAGLPTGGTFDTGGFQNGLKLFEVLLKALSSQVRDDAGRLWSSLTRFFDDLNEFFTL